MAANFPGPWEVRINYTVDVSGVVTHQQRLSFDVASVAGEIGDPFSDWVPEERDGDATVSLLNQMTTYTDLVKAYYSSDLNLVDAELWKYALGTFDATWYSSMALAIPGEAATASIKNSEQIFTTRTTAGGIMRVHYMEGPVTRGGKQVLPLGNAPLDALADYFVHDNNIWRGRDGGYPIAFLGMFPGENERMFKKTYR